MHRLLQTLPSMDAAHREAAAGRYLARVGRDWPETERTALWHSVDRILRDPGFTPLFAETSRAEVSIMGTVTLGEAEHAVSGKIDRLAVTGDEVLIVDYKTNRPPPRRLAEAPAGYVAQMALYRALLAPLYPGKAVRAALLFTEAPILLPVPPEAMEEALVRLSRA